MLTLNPFHLLFSTIAIQIRFKRFNLKSSSLYSTTTYLCFAGSYMTKKPERLKVTWGGISWFGGPRLSLLSLLSGPPFTLNTAKIQVLHSHSLLSNFHHSALNTLYGRFTHNHIFSYLFRIHQILSCGSRLSYTGSVSCCCSLVLLSQPHLCKN